MKNKKKTYLLLAIVVIIWALLIYRFFSLTVGDTAELLPEQIHMNGLLAVKKRDTFSVNVNYRDPFLGKMYVADNTIKPQNKRPKKVEPVVWPDVIYKGMVSDTKDKKKVFMLIIDGKTYLMKEKETEEGITLKKGNRESIDIKYKGEAFSILIQE